MTLPFRRWALPALVVTNEFCHEHKNVLQRIRKLADQGTLTELDFKLSEYTAR